MYIYGNYVPDRANTNDTKNAAYVFNLETGEAGYFDLPHTYLATQPLNMNLYLCKYMVPYLVPK